MYLSSPPHRVEHCAQQSAKICKMNQIIQSEEFVDFVSWLDVACLDFAEVELAGS